MFMILILGLVSSTWKSWKPIDLSLYIHLQYIHEYCIYIFFVYTSTMYIIVQWYQFCYPICLEFQTFQGFQTWVLTFSRTKPPQTSPLIHVFCCCCRGIKVLRWTKPWDPWDLWGEIMVETVCCGNKKETIRLPFCGKRPIFRVFAVSFRECN